jgi:hypothetical protein
VTLPERTGVPPMDRQIKVYTALRITLVWGAALLIVSTFAAVLILLIQLNNVAEANQRINVENQHYIRETAICLSILPRADRTEAGIEKCIEARMRAAKGTP